MKAMTRYIIKYKGHPVEVKTIDGCEVALFPSENPTAFNWASVALATGLSVAVRTGLEPELMTTEPV